MAEVAEVDPYVDVQDHDISSNDGDSTFSETSTMTTSLSSSMLNYVYENGRRYQQIGEGSYTLPNDEQEQERLDMLHHIFRLVQRGQLHTTQIKDSQRVLDIGTGTGIWALEFADQFPGSEVIGIDSSPIQPTWTAPNCRFIIDDLEQDWLYPGDGFDYIHQRSMSGSIKDWTRLYRQALAQLRPGGWLEIQEFEVWFYSQMPGGLPEDSAISKWQRLIDEGSTKIGRRLNYASRFKEHLEGAGYINIQTQIIKTPIGAWPKDSKLRELGIFLQVQMAEALEAVTLAYFTRILGWSDLETKVFLAQVKSEFDDKSKHLYTFCWFITGKKP